MIERGNIPQGYKYSKLGIIPREWHIETLGTICYTICSGKNKTKSTEGEYPVYGSTGIIGYTNQYAYNKPLILIARVGANAGKVNKVDGFFDVSDNTLIIDVKPTIYFLFLYNLLQMSSLNRLVFGSGQPLITAGTLRLMQIVLPPIEEQKKIVEVLSEWDKAIEQQTKLIENLELRKRALMQRLLTGRVRLNGFSDKWQVKLLCELGTFEKGYGVPKEQIREKGHKALTYGEIYTQYDYVIKKFVSFIDAATAEISKPISCGAILFAGSGETLEDIGKCIAYVDNDIAYAGGDIIIFNPNPNIDSLVLSYYLNSPSTIIQKRRYGQGHSVVHIYTKDLAKIKVLLPSLAEQTAIAEVLISADKEIELAKNKLSSLRHQKRGLMQQLLTGKKRIKL